jgi:hypothetical protein
VGGRVGTIVVNDYAEKYDFKVKVDADSRMFGHTEFYFYKEDLEVIYPLDSATPGEYHFRQRGENIAVES